MAGTRRQQGTKDRPFDGRSVLLVEDDADVRQMIGAVLERQGASVTQAADASEAKRLIERATFDALLLDWNLPDTSGDVFLDWLSKREPRLHRRTLVVTGRLTTMRTAENDVLAGVKLLAKPFRPGQLKTALAEVLRAAGED